MKTLKFKDLKIAIVLLSFVLPSTINAQIGGWNPELENEAKEALQAMIKKTPKLKSYRDQSYGYAVFPKVTKAAITIGGAIGNGVVYKNKKVVGTAKLKQASFGLQFGGQQYSEVIFFENQEFFERFTNGKLKFDAQASAVVLKEGASVDVAYQEGVAVFTSTKGGVMVEASIGGQHFKYTPKK
ncbi:YSC84-related protein [Aquimarina celericrescens]|uniref:YSC84-related protein n=1 Tax=Aquimarina celericrescens TaxID=1964542 RepID=A0ABW5B036_9FLAO|nr:lipid-binding SYLF domain-containing protein [Aquimarina celericrescens]